jgi:pyruvate formate-lyase activating enzyme-like uncharacterized protein
MKKKKKNIIKFIYKKKKKRKQTNGQVPHIISMKKKVFATKNLLSKQASSFLRDRYIKALENKNINRIKKKIIYRII